MSGSDEGRRFSRILLALGASGNRTALEFSASLATALEIPIEALFIEDEDLLAIAALPFTRETSWLGRAVPSFDPERLEREFRREALALQRLAQRYLPGGTVECRFQVVRGQSAQAVSGALRPGDLLALPRWLGPITGQGRLGSAVQTALAGQWSALLLLDSSLPISPGPIVTYYDGSDAAADTLQVALRISRGQQRALNVLLPPGTPAETRALHRRVLADLPPAQPVEITVLAPVTGIEDLLGQLARVRAGLLVLPEGPLDLAAERLDGFLRRCRVPLLLLRAPA